MSEDRNERGQFQPGHQIQPAVTAARGGEGVLKRFQNGEPFTGLGQAMYQAVVDDLAFDLDKLPSIDRLIAERTCRLEAMARLFDFASAAAEASGDTLAWERYLQRSGWLSGKSLVALRDLRELAVRAGLIICENAVDYEDILSRG